MISFAFLLCSIMQIKATSEQPAHIKFPIMLDGAANVLKKQFVLPSLKYLMH